MATTSVARTCPGDPRRWNLSLSLHFFNAVFSNRPSLTVDPAEHLYLVGTTALPLPYEDKYEAAAFENSVFSHPLFLEKYLAFASVAAARIYGRISPVNLCYAMYYEVPRENKSEQVSIMKSGVLVGFPHFDSLREAEAMARDLNTAYRHPEYPKEVKFAATKIPSDTPIRIHREDHSMEGLEKAAMSVHSNISWQWLRAAAHKFMNPTGIHKDRGSRVLKEEKVALGMILYARRNEDVNAGLEGLWIDVIAFDPDERTNG